MTSRRLALVALLAFLATGSLAAPPTQPATREQRESPGDHLVVTHHDLAFPGNAEPLHYTATAGTMAFKDDAGKPRANFFFVAYQKDPGANFDPAARPITFCFNGGPGAAAVWLHLGAVGPRKIAMDDAGETVPTPPYRLEDNAGCWLEFTDLVFLDPVGTGYSRAAEGVKGEEFYGVENDLRSVSEFIRLYTTRNDRWLSPKFLAGESYGTTRAAGLSDRLLENTGIALNGIIFISTVLDFGTLSPGRTNDAPYALYLPTYAATAWYHKKLDADLQKDLRATLAEVEKYAAGDYASLLSRGDSLTDAERADAAKRLSRYTSLPADRIEKDRLRIGPTEFRKQLLREERQIIGRFDARQKGIDLDPASERVEFDPGFPQLYAAYTASMTDYARRGLHFESDLSYDVLTGRVQPWSMGERGSGYLDVASNLRDAMQKNPSMKVLFASGYYDLATPHFATDWTINHMGLSPRLRENVTRSFYQGGHMMYHVKESLLKLKSDVGQFVRTAAPSARTIP